MRASVPRMEATRSFSLPVGVLMTAVAGALDANLFMTRGGVFGTAQSGNIVIVGVRLADEQWSSALHNLYPVLSFALGALVVESLLAVPRFEWFRRNVAEAAVVTSAVVVIVVGALPPSAPDEVATIAIGAVAAFQLTAFRKVVDLPFATTMSTGNLRSLAASAVEAARTRERPAVVRMRAYGLVIASFAAGAVLCGQLTTQFDTRAIWLAAVLLVGAYVLIRRDRTSLAPAT
jgi:uncharacterized membrane protein YoaK (UPF0700 family)